MARHLDAFCAAHGIPSPVTRSIQVALDELLSNSVGHRSPAQQAEGRIDVRFARDDDAVEVEVQDDGPAFDPLATRAPDTSAGLADRRMGGLGLLLVRKLMDSVEYRRQDGLNCVVIRKKTGGEAAPMEVHEERADGKLVIAPSGRIDSTTAGELENVLLKRLEAGESRVVVDLVGVEYISSAGLRVLLKAAKTMRERRGGLVLCSLGRSVREVFELAGLAAVFTIEASRTDALTRLR